MQALNNIKTYIFITLAITFAFEKCTRQKGKENLEWIESQTLCVYWSPDFEKRDTLSAINFIVESKSKVILNESEFLFLVDGKDYTLRKTRLIVKGQFFFQGLKLECSQLYEDFKDDIYVEDGPCYEKALVSMVHSGRLFIKSSPNVEINKSESFKLYQGLKEE